MVSILLTIKYILKIKKKAQFLPWKFKIHSMSTCSHAMNDYVLRLVALRFSFYLYCKFIALRHRLRRLCQQVVLIILHWHITKELLSMIKDALPKSKLTSSRLLSIYKTMFRQSFHAINPIFRSIVLITRLDCLL